MNERVALLKKLILSLITSLAFVFSTPYITQASPLAYLTERIAGQDQVETALKISQKGWNSAQTVILCESNDYPDSIAAAPFAANLDAPILLTKGKSIDPRVVKELQRLSPQKVILLGGTACLQPSIEKELDQLSLPWERIGGIDRYETSVLLAKELISDSVILANGDNFPDALSAATYAAIKRIPIVLTSTKLPDSVIQYYQETAPAQLIVIGGEAVIPSEELNKHYFNIGTRLAGYDRYGTNAAVVSYMKDTYQSNDLFVASGITFPDAVAGTVLASKFKAPLLLTENEDIPASVYTIMRQHMKVEPPASNTGNNASEDSNDSTSSSTSNLNNLFQGKITASGSLNLRESPSSSGTVLTTIPEGSVINLIAKQDQWYKTTYQSKTGWVSATYLTVISKKGTVTASGSLNLRETPSSTGKILATIPSNASVELIAQQGQWYQTTYQAKTGWIAADYVTVNTTGDNSPPPENNPSTPDNNSSTPDNNTPSKIDLSANGKVYILGGTGIISANSQGIMEGKASSKYKDNLKAFPPLPSEIKEPTTPSSGDDSTTPDNNNDNPPEITYDPSTEVLINPFDVIPANALAGKTIMIDPGHGGPDTGAIGPTPTYEKNNTLAIALDLETALKQAGAKVILTRDEDVALCSPYTEIEDLQARVNLAEQQKPDLFISIHNDGNLNSEIQGTTTYYSGDNTQAYQSQQLASSIQSAVIDTVDTKNRGVKEAAFYVLRKTTMPAVLLETAFISSPYEEARLQNSTFRQNVANAILIGIYNYYKNPLPGA
ncbi:N-acetylmuramoyl-L-alanine amidase [Desulfosporosinus orientis DSM 765]|uniref:N-acetylmuramoyl-L-alanine amidase n=1 Tax=Desulfosporosinus orientis (strain ATCC 19365 / DSM 765 / NCIMB 8382 / VKM B-1628 / Singapore I) TaxID=768706 RepID=G7WFV1_DESOD|nr:cell wall-binding repeat-containing protein [Desulfosporosinus orientis]AET69466.1 N-acetylmuramoyl-L-alanine amidase [Desulfosporosinus orientis DSM 765]